MLRADRRRSLLSVGSRPRAAALLATCIVLFGGAGPASAAVNPSTTTVGCSPASLHPGQATTCTVTVTGSVRPTGTVTFTGNSSGTFNPATCTLAPIGGNQARCSVSYTPATVGSGVHKVFASYAWMHYVYGMTRAEIAGKTGFSEMQVKGYLQYGL